MYSSHVSASAKETVSEANITNHPSSNAGFINYKQTEEDEPLNNRPVKNAELSSNFSNSRDLHDEIAAPLLQGSMFRAFLMNQSSTAR